MITSPALSNINGIRHGFFGRKGGVSDGLYASLNCGYGSGDDIEKVAINRERVCDSLGGGMPFLTCHQVHSAKVMTVDAPWDWKNSPEADAMVTDKPGIPLGILTADCLPVLFSDTKKRLIGAAHAGWKGAVGGVLEATVQAMHALGAQNIIAGIGPAITQNSYEVGAEFVERFKQESPDNARYFNLSAQGAARSGGVWGEDPQRAKRKYKFDLPAYAKARLMKAGVAQTEILAYDTCSLETEFFSYRRATLRGESVYGRQVSVIIINPVTAP